MEENPDFLIMEQEEDNRPTSPPRNVSSPSSGGRLHVSPVRLELFYDEDAAVTTTQRAAAETTMNLSTGSSDSNLEIVRAAKSEADHCEFR